MKYCDACGGILVPAADNMLQCRNCEESYSKDEAGEIVVSEKKQEVPEHIDIEGKGEGLPSTEIDCEECGNDEAYWWMFQTRSSDEPETRFFKCTECSHTWREYD